MIWDCWLGPWCTLMVSGASTQIDQVLLGGGSVWQANTPSWPAATSSSTDREDHFLWANRPSLATLKDHINLLCVQVELSLRSLTVIGPSTGRPAVSIYISCLQAPAGSVSLEMHLSSQEQDTRLSTYLGMHSWLNMIKQGKWTSPIEFRMHSQTSDLLDAVRKHTKRLVSLPAPSLFVVATPLSHQVKPSQLLRPVEWRKCSTKLICFSSVE